MPHTLILQMLFSRLQAARYCRSAVMFLIQRLVLRSARAHKLFRYFMRSIIRTSAKDLFSTHPLARELRYSFLLFGLETLKSSHLDAVCECMLRESLYRTAYSWFAVRPQSVYLRSEYQHKCLWLPRWSFGANRVQVDADIKVLFEFLAHLQVDSVRSSTSLSSLNHHQSASKISREHSELLSLHWPEPLQSMLSTSRISTSPSAF